MDFHPCCGWMTVWVGFFLLTEASPDPSSQHVLHTHAVTFEEAAARCLPLGLTTVRTQQDVSQILELVSGSAALPKEDFVFWVGLKKERTECVSPSLPLRGFRWTRDGGQDSQVVRWAEEPEGTCTGVRCAALKGRLNGSVVTTWGLVAASCRQRHGSICKGTTAGPSRPAQEPMTTRQGAEPESPKPFTPAPAGTKPATTEPKPSAPGLEQTTLSDLEQRAESSPEPETSPGPELSAAGPHSGLVPASDSCQNPVIPGARSLSMEPDDGVRIRVECWSSVQLDLFCSGQTAVWRVQDGSPANFSDVCQPCPAGFYKDASGHCENVDECSGAPCRHRCLNTRGSFRCVCVDESGNYHDDGAAACGDTMTVENAQVLSGVLVPALVAMAAVMLLAAAVGVAVKCFLMRRSRKHAVKKVEKMGGVDSLEAANEKTAA